MMNEQFILLLKSVPKDNPLNPIVESVLLPELKTSAKLAVLDTASEFQNFEGIYKRRHQHLSSRNIKNYGILESIPRVSAHSGKVKSVSIDTKRYQGYAWADQDFTNLIGLVLVSKEGEERSATDPS